MEPETGAPAASCAGREQQQGPQHAHARQLALNLLQTIRGAQTQNGLKHGDYGRYRVFCARRLRSLYKGLKFTHGKGRYQRRKLEVGMIADARWLLIPLISAERAWAQAMEIKRDNEDHPLPQRRHHSIRRLTKAGAWAADLARFAAEVCDTRSALEAEAYAAWMAGNVLLEREADWSRALGDFSRAKRLFAELAKVGDLDSQGLCGAMVEEIEPSIRFCDYQIKRGGGAAPPASELLALGSGEVGGGEAAARGLLASKLAALQAEAQVQELVSAGSFEWRGHTHPVRHEKVRVTLHTARELAAALDAAAGATDGTDAGTMDVDGAEGGVDGGAAAADGRLAAFDRAINALAEARAAVRALARTNAAGDGGGESALEELTALDKAITGALLERTLERGEEQVAKAEARFEAASARAAAGKRGGARQERGAKPEDLLRLHEGLMHHSEELGELASGLGGRQGEALGDVAAARSAAYAAGRCYYVAHTYLAGSKRSEAAALFGRCVEGRVGEAREKLEDLPKGEAAARAALPRLAVLAAKARAWQLVAAAEAAAEAAATGEEARRGIAGLGLVSAGNTAGSGARYLSEGLDAWEAYGGSGGGKGARLCPAPYPLQAVAARPVMLDTASAGVQYPSLAHRLRPGKKPFAVAGQQTSTFARLFGWGATSAGSK